MICVFGSINVDHVMRVRQIARPGETVLATDLVYRQGGKGANQAVAAARAGARVAMIGAVGRDANGAGARANLRANGVDDHAVADVDLPTGCAFISVDDQGENAITVVSGANRAVRLERLPDGCRALVCQLELSIDLVAEALEQARMRGIQTILNLAPVSPNVTRAQVERTISAADVLVVNEGEFRDLCHLIEFEATHQPITTLSAGLGCRLVVTCGAAGVRFCSNERDEEHVPAFPVEVKDSTGAGDTFVGVLAADLASGENFDAAVLNASIGGALACTRIGAQEGSPSRSEIIAASARSPARLK